MPKPGGHHRFCVSNRLLKELTRKEVYPIPKFYGFLDSRGDAMAVSLLNYMCGYLKIRVVAEDTDKKSFMSHTGLFRFLRPPFGLFNVPTFFQSPLDIILSGLSWQSFQM